MLRLDEVVKADELYIQIIFPTTENVRFVDGEERHRHRYLNLTEEHAIRCKYRPRANRIPGANDVWGAGVILDPKVT